MMHMSCDVVNLSCARR